MITVDARGLKCPAPLIQTKKALKEAGTDEEIKIIIDNNESKENVLRFLADNGVEALLSEDKGLFEIWIRKLSGEPEMLHPEDYCQEDTGLCGSDYVMVFAKNYVGEGSVALGEILMEGFLEAILYQEERPSKIVFYNSGVFLVLDDSPHLPTFRGMEDMGIELLVCGTCLKFHNKLEALGVGKVSNAYEIFTSIRKARRSIQL